MHRTTQNIQVRPLVDTGLWRSGRASIYDATTSRPGTSGLERFETPHDWCLNPRPTAQQRRSMKLSATVKGAVGVALLNAAAGITGLLSWRKAAVRSENST